MRPEASDRATDGVTASVRALFRGSRAGSRFSEQCSPSASHRELQPGGREGLGGFRRESERVRRLPESGVRKSGR